MKDKKRVIYLALFTFALFSLLIVQYFKIQIIEGEKWESIALSQHHLIVKQPFRRGAFFSNTSLKKGHPEIVQPLVFDVTKFHLYIDPMMFAGTTKEEVAASLIRLAHIEKEKEEETKAAFHKTCHSRKVAMWLDKQTKEVIELWWYPYAKTHKIPKNAIYFVTDYKRSYPYGKLLGQVLHTIRDDKEELTKQGIPTGGLEAEFNDYLKGVEGKRCLLRSPLKVLETEKIVKAPEDGCDITLTINHTLQAIAEEELEKGVKAATAKGGWAVILDPVTGEIYALAQYPFFEPAHYREYFNDPEKLVHTKSRSITDAFELGSIMKPITLAVCLKANRALKQQGEAPLFLPEEKIQTTQSIFPGRARKPLKDLTLHRWLNMYMALQKSSNVYMAILADRLVNRLGNEWYLNTLKETFGFGEKTHIELPGEGKGFLPAIGKTYPNGTIQWSLSTPYSLCMGYNLLATSIQMLRAYAVIANGGFLIEPTLVKKISKKESKRKKAFKRVMEFEDTREIIKAMKYVTKPGGTSMLGEIYGFTEAGKSATAEKIVDGNYSNVHISSFIGFCPANLRTPPRFVLIVTMDEPAAFIRKNGKKNHHGGTCAAPVFAEIAKRTLEYLGESPDDPHGYPSQDPRYDSEKADWILEAKALKELYDQWNGA